jgi:hypothetical protein
MPDGWTVVSLDDVPAGTFIAVRDPTVFRRAVAAERGTAVPKLRTALEQDPDLGRLLTEP